MKAIAPDDDDVRSLWTILRANHRERPAALVTAMVGAYMLASDAAGGAIDKWSPLGCKMVAWRRFVGHADNASWTKRLRELVDVGLLRRDGRRVVVAPTKAWFTLAEAAAIEDVFGSLDGLPERSRRRVLDWAANHGAVVS